VAIEQFDMLPKEEIIDQFEAVLLRGIISSHEASLTYPAMAVQLRPDILNEKDVDKAINYLQKYFGNIPKIPKVKVYWGTARVFKRIERKMGEI
jgi:hypothetical protein